MRAEVQVVDPDRLKAAPTITGRLKAASTYVV